MARKWIRRLFCCFAILAMAPGCQLLPRSARAPDADVAVPFDPSGEAKHEHLVTGGNIIDPPAASKTRPQPAPPELLVPDRTGNPSGGLAPNAPVVPKTDVARVSADPAMSSALGLPAVVFPDRQNERGGPNVFTVQSSIVPSLVPQPANAEKKPQEYAPLVRALQFILEGRNPEAIQQLQVYDRETQEFFLQLLPALVILVKTPLDKLTPPQIAVLNGQLEGIQQKLRPRSELIVSKMRFCRTIYAFASTDDLPEKHRFLAGSGDRPGEEALLYVELKNLASEPTGDGDFVTKLAVTLELKDGNGKGVWTHSYPRSKTTYPRKARINDFCSGYSFCVPDLAPGTYQLWIQIIDESIPEIRRVTRKSIDFRVTPVAESVSR